MLSEALSLAKSSTSPEVLDELASHQNEKVREFVASNKNTSPHTLLRLASDTHNSVLYALCANHSTPTKALDKIWKSKKISLSYPLLSNPNLSSHLLKEFSIEQSSIQRALVAKHKNTLRATLERLSTDRHQFVRVTAIKNTKNVHCNKMYFCGMNSNFFLQTPSFQHILETSPYRSMPFPRMDLWMSEYFDISNTLRG